MAARGRVDRVAWGVAVAASAWCVVGILLRGSVHDWTSGDTMALVAGVPAITHCLTWPQMIDAGSCVGVSKFQLLQQIPAYLLHLLGASPAATIGVLAWLNALAVVGLVAATAVVAQRIGGLPVAVIATLLMSCGVLLPYSAQGAAEPLAAAAFGALCLASLRTDRPSRWLIPAAVLATWSKETAAPFAFLFALAALGLCGAGFALIRRVMMRVVIGIVIAGIPAVDFNWIRYHSIFNVAYLDESRAPASMWLSNGFGMLISPNAGIAWFWPGAIIAVIVLCLAVVRPGKFGRDGWPIRLGAVAALIAFGVMVASLADWWSPFGWYAWGPRLLIPISAAMVVLAIPMIARRRLPRSWLSPPGAVALAIVCCLTLMPNVAVIFQPRTYATQISATWRLIPDCGPKNREKSPELVNRCGNHNTWSTASMPLTKSVQKALPQSSYLGLIGAGWVAIVLWLLIAYRGARRMDISAPESRHRETLEADPALFRSVSGA